MVYQWKTSGLFNVDAQKAGEELERISAKKSLTPQNIVDESRSKSAILHKCFDWNDITAAESYRQVQAQSIIRNIVTANVEGEDLKEPVRAFVSIQNDYKPINVVVSTKDYQEEMLLKAIGELRSFQRKYSSLKQLADIFASIEQLVQAG